MPLSVRDWLVLMKRVASGSQAFTGLQPSRNSDGKAGPGRQPSQSRSSWLSSPKLHDLLRRARIGVERRYAIPHEKLKLAEFPDAASRYQSAHYQPVAYAEFANQLLPPEQTRTKYVNKPKIPILNPPHSHIRWHPWKTTQVFALDFSCEIERGWRSHSFLASGRLPELSSSDQDILRARIPAVDVRVREH